MADSPCPPSETLAAYVSGRLYDHELAGIANHLLECERCYDTIAAAASSVASSWERADASPPLALLPAMATATAIAITLTVCLLLLNNPA